MAKLTNRDITQVEEIAEGSHYLPVAEWQDGSGSHQAVIEKKVVVGAGSGADIVVRDAFVSGAHAELEPRDGGLFVRDLNSRNGTFVDGVSIRSAFVPYGGSVRLGTTNVRVFSRIAAPRATTEHWPEARFQRLEHIS